jgi:hypothetical protein
MCREMAENLRLLVLRGWCGKTEKGIPVELGKREASTKREKKTLSKH